MDKPLWQPSAERIAATNLARFMRYARRRWDAQAGDYDELYAWSIAQSRAILASGVVVLRRDRRSPASGPVLDNGERMPGARWFPGARLNFAENLLRRRDARHRARVPGRGPRAEPRHLRRALRGGLAARAGAARRGRRAAATALPAIFPTCPAPSIAMLATTSLGAIWSSCSPDFGVQGVLDRFGQIEPKVLVRRGRLLLQRQDDRLRCRACRDMPGSCRRVENTIVVPYTRRDPRIGDIPRAMTCTISWRRSARGTSRSSACPSTIRSTSCTPRARPACRSASCTARAAPCCST